MQLLLMSAVYLLYTCCGWALSEANHTITISLVKMLRLHSIQCASCFLLPVSETSGLQMPPTHVEAFKKYLL